MQKIIAASVLIDLDLVIECNPSLNYRYVTKEGANMKVYKAEIDTSRPGYNRINNDALLRDLGYARGMCSKLGIDRDLSLSELVEHWQQRFGAAICDTLNKFNTGKTITIEDIPNFEEFQVVGLENLLHHTRRVAEYAHTCFAKGSGYGVNIDFSLRYQLTALFKIKGISLNIFEDRDVSTYCTIVYDEVKGIRALTHKEILSAEGLSDDEIKVSFTEQLAEREEVRNLERMESELHIK